VKVILIEEERFPEILALMKARVDKIDRGFLGAAPDIGDAELKHIVEAVYRAMHYEFVCWAKSHGASCIRS
jgi:hypothetical protein